MPSWAAATATRPDPRGVGMDTISDAAAAPPRRTHVPVPPLPVSVPGFEYNTWVALMPVTHPIWVSKLASVMSTLMMLPMAKSCAPMVSVEVFAVRLLAVTV